MKKKVIFENYSIFLEEEYKIKKNEKTYHITNENVFNFNMIYWKICTDIHYFMNERGSSKCRIKRFLINLETLTSLECIIIYSRFVKAALLQLVAISIVRLLCFLH